MFSALKNHPFAVEAFFESSLVFTFSVPKEEVQHLIPACLSLDSLDNRWAFIAVAMVHTRNLRPKRFPRFFGNDFFLVGYRVFVRYTNQAGKTLRGLYILKSETDRKRMELLGNVFTHYKYTTTDIQQTRSNGSSDIASVKSGFNVKFHYSESGTVPLPEGSPFNDWREARRFAGPLPFTFSFNADKKKVLIIEGKRANWNPMPVKVEAFSFSFLDSLNLKNLKLANAFVVRNVPYYWEKGRTEKWV